MPKEITPRRLMRLLGLSMLPLLAAQAQEVSCWLRDAAAPADSSETYVLCEKGQVMVTSDGGATWGVRETGAADRLRGIVFTSSNAGAVVGDHGLVLTTEDRGKTWQQRQTGTSENLTSVVAIGRLVWAAGYGGVILHSADAGRTWALQNSPTTQALESIYFVDPEHGWAVGWVGTFLRTDDGGKTWQQVKSPHAAWSLSAVYFRDVSNGWAVGFGGTILRTRDGGVTWQGQASPVGSSLTSVCFDKANRGWITTHSGFLVSQNGGEDWKVQDVEDRLFLSRVLPIRGTLWALSPFTLLQQESAGTSWRKLPAPVVKGASSEPATKAATQP